MTSVIKLTPAKVATIRRTLRRNKGDTCVTLALRYGVAATTIYMAAIGVTWQEVPEKPVKLLTARPYLATRERRDRTVTWISKDAMRYLTKRKNHPREAIGHVLDRVLRDHRNRTQ